MRIHKDMVVWVLVPTVMLSGGAVAAAAAAPVPASTSTARSQSLPWTSSELVKGVFFHDGPVAGRLPQQHYRSMPDLTDAQRRAVDEIVTSVDQRTPGTTQLFKDALESGSPTRVKDALSTVSRRLGEVARHSADAQRLITPDCAAFLIVAAFGFFIWAMEVYTTYAVITNNSRVNTVDQDRFITDVLSSLSRA